MKILRKFKVKFLTDVPQTVTYEVQNFEVEVEVDYPVCGEKTISRAITSKINDMWARDEIDPTMIGYEKETDIDTSDADIYNLTFEEVIDKEDTFTDPNQVELFDGV